jgi:hypothetical protein
MSRILRTRETPTSDPDNSNDQNSDQNDTYSSGSETDIANKLAEVKEIKKKLRSNNKNNRTCGSGRSTAKKNVDLTKTRTRKPKTTKPQNNTKMGGAAQNKISDAELKRIFEVAALLKKKWVSENNHYNNMLQLCTGDAKKDKSIVAELEKQKNKCNAIADEYEKIRNLL